MKKIRTRYFRITLYSVLGFSALFLAWVLIFGKSIAMTHFDGVLDSVFAILVLAAGSFLTFSFLPFFKGDRRWYSISAIFTGVFFVGAMILWQVPVALPAVGVV